MLSHPNLTKVYKLEVRRDLLFRPLALRLLLEFAPGRPLDRGPALPLQRAVRVFERIASALEHMHSRGVIHADVKPGNLIFDPERGIKLIDFGLARIARERDFRVRGTPQYMAPETASLGIVTTRTDIYNLGATMYHLVTGRPLPAPMPSTLPGVRIQPSPVVPVDHLIPDAPRRLCEVIHSCTAADPDQRPIGVGEVSRALAGICRAHGW
jgi:serine/threonine-protein kinase